jgi:hypothetical protein
MRQINQRVHSLYARILPFHLDHHLWFLSLHQTLPLKPVTVALTMDQIVCHLCLWRQQKHLRNVVPYTNIPFEKQGIQGNAEKFKDTTYASVLVPSIIAHTDQKKGENTYGCHGKQQKVLKEYGTTNM